MRGIQSIQTKDLVVHILREQILPGGLKPGEGLAQKDVTEKLGVSKVPMRETLQVLTQEGFLIGVHNRHVCVSRIRRTQVLELLRIMATVEAEMLGMLDERVVQVLSAYIDETVRMLEEGGEDEGRQMELEYHWLIGELPDNPHLQQMLKKLQEGYLSYVLLKLPFIHNGRVAHLRRLGGVAKEIGGSGTKDALLGCFEHLADDLPDRTAALQEERVQQMKIVVLGGYTENPGDLTQNEASAVGDLTVYDRAPVDDEEEIIRRVGDTRVVYTNKVSLDRTVFNVCPSIAFVCLLATGYNVVNAGCIREKGIPVSGTPAYGTDSVGQFTIFLLLEICHHTGRHDQAVKSRRWEKSAGWYLWDYPLIELAGKTMGIIGFGRTGQKVRTIVKALGMSILTYDQYPNNIGRAITAYTDLDTLFGNSDVIALHCPLFPETEWMINRKSIGRTKDSVIILNNSRDPLIHQQDLTEALNSGKVFVTGLDAVGAESTGGDNPFSKAKNCIIMPHIFWAPREARQRIMDMAAGNLKAFLAGEPASMINGGQRIQEALMCTGTEKLAMICATTAPGCL